MTAWGISFFSCYTKFSFSYHINDNFTLSESSQTLFRLWLRTKNGTRSLLYLALSIKCLEKSVSQLVSNRYIAETWIFIVVNCLTLCQRWQNHRWFVAKLKLTFFYEWLDTLHRNDFFYIHNKMLQQSLHFATKSSETWLQMIYCETLWQRWQNNGCFFAMMSLLLQMASLLWIDDEDNWFSVPKPMKSYCNAIYIVVDLSPPLTFAMGSLRKTWKDTTFLSTTSSKALPCLACC